MGKILFIIIITVYIAKSENGVPPTTHPYCVSSKHQRSPYISSRQVPHAIPYHDQTIPYQLCWKIVPPSNPLSATCQKVHPGWQWPVNNECLWISNTSRLKLCVSLNWQYLRIVRVHVFVSPISKLPDLKTHPEKNWLADLTKVKRFIQSNISDHLHM